MPDGLRPDHLPLRPGALLGVARRPDLWATAARTAWLLAAPGWWRHWPPVPRPPDDYGAFRHQTMFGSRPGSGLDGGQLVGYLEWCRGMRRLQ